MLVIAAWPTQANATPGGDPNVCASPHLDCLYGAGALAVGSKPPGGPPWLPTAFTVLRDVMWRETGRWVTNPERRDDSRRVEWNLLQSRTMKRTLKAFGLLAIAAYLAAVVAALIIKLTRPSHGDEESDTVDLVTIFTGLELASRARSFLGGTVLTMFGGAEIDLRNATPDPEGACLEVRTIFGGTEILVPEEWNVVLDAQSILGGSENRAGATGATEGPTLRVHALTVFGGLDISSRPRSEA